jgi:hypothetical protein
MRNEPLTTAPFWRCALLSAALALPYQASAVPGDILFSDNFERGNLAPWTTSNASRSGILAGGAVSNSPTRGAYTRRNVVTITSPNIAAAVPSADISFWVRHGSDAFSEYPDDNEDLVVEYRRTDNSWAQLAIYRGGGVAGQIFNDTFILPPDALHGTLAIRARQTGGSNGNFDWWHLDDVVVTEIAPPPVLAVGACDDFESGLVGNWTVNAISGLAGTSAATSQSPTMAMTLNGGVVDVTSGAIDASDPTFGDVSMWVRRGSDTFSEFPDPAEDLVVEYLNDVGGWVALETFTGGGTAGQVFLRTYPIPANGRHAGFRLRFRQTGGSGAPWDFWHVDDVCLNQLVLPDLLVTKSVQTISDPINGGSNPKAIPGAVMLYTINVSNQGPGTVDSNTMLVVDAVPPDSDLFVDTGSGDPIVFADGPVASGLSYNYGANVTFTNQAGGGPPFNYTPSPDGQGFDPAVTGYRVNPGGSMSAASGSDFPAFSVLLRVRVR